MNRNISLDVLKVVLAFMVVGIHTHFLIDISPLAEFLLGNGLFRIAVPVFLLISGFYFYHAVESGNALSWIKKLSVMYLFWMMFYSFFWLRFSELSVVDVAKIIKVIVVGYHHLWYISGMIGAAILLFFLRGVSNNILFVFVALTYLLGVITQYLGYYHAFEGAPFDSILNKSYINRSFLFFSFPFFCLGFLIRKLNIHQLVSFDLLLILVLVGLGLLVGESYINYVQISRDGGFDNFASLIIICPAVFILFVRLNLRGESKALTLYASGIYFVHPLFISVFRGFTDLNGTVLTIVVFLTSVVFSSVLIKLILLINSRFLVRANKKVDFVL